MFLFGERIKGTSDSLGERFCPVCDASKSFRHVNETNYFCLFGIRLLPLEKHADYHLCDFCENAFTEPTDGAYQIPSQAMSARSVIGYILVGYGMQGHLKLGCEIFKKVTGFEMSAEELTHVVRKVSVPQQDLINLLKSESSNMNIRGKQQIIEAAFLVTHACCEIEYEDRVRINLIANAMDIPIGFVSATIEQVRQQGCYGVHRILPTGITSP